MSDPPSAPLRTQKNLPEYKRILLKKTNVIFPLNFITDTITFKMSKFLIYLFLCYVTLVSCDTSTPCSDSISCGEMQISGYLEKLEDTPSIPVIGGLVTLEKDTLPDEEQTRSSEDIVERSARFLASRSLKIRLPREEARSLVAGKILKWIYTKVVLYKTAALILLMSLLIFPA